MNKWLGAAVAGLLMVSTAWAGSTGPASASQSSTNLPQTRQAVARQKTEVARLQQNIAAQEARSQRADQQLQQQDQTIAALRKRLQEVRTRPVNRVAE